MKELTILIIMLAITAFLLGLQVGKSAPNTSIRDTIEQAFLERKCGWWTVSNAETTRIIFDCSNISTSTPKI
jgi:hypothetical protein